MKTSFKRNNYRKQSAPFIKKTDEGFFSHSKEKEPPFATPVQPKLNVGKPNDKYEKEADAVAEQVVQGKQVSPTLNVQRKCAECENEEKEKVQKKGEEDQEVMTKRAFDTSMGEEQVQTKSEAPAKPDIEQDLQTSKGGGTPLPKDVQSEMESGIGADFSGVKVHNDSKAVQMNADLNSQAFTNGKDVYFNQGKYQPESKEGKKLLAHELTHVVQQTGGKKSVQKKENEQTEQQASKPSTQYGKPSTSIKQLNNGQTQMTQTTSFTQVIARKQGDAAKGQEEGGEQQQEDPIFVKQMAPSEEIISSRSNSVSASLAHNATVSGGRVPDPGNFGTTGATLHYDNVSISSSLGTIIGSGTYTVTGDVVHTITWGVLSGTGPSSQVDIASDTDSDIKACNYQLISKDLTPDMSSDNGRPPRDHFWAEDLTIRHERFHAIDQRELDWGPQIVTAMETWLSGQTSPSASNVRSTLLPAAMTEGIRVYNAFVAAPAAEGDAYGDGAPLYRARANSIKTKGDAGDYGQVSIEVTNHPKGGGTHTVVAGDTLWGIAEQVYGHGKHWRAIHRANPGVARRGGNLIFPGQVFNLPHINFDQELGPFLTFGANMVIEADVVIPGGGSHTFTVPANQLFDDTTNCAGNMDVDIMDPDGNSLLNAIWDISGNTTARNNNIEANMQITTGPAGP